MSPQSNLEAARYYVEKIKVTITKIPYGTKAPNNKNWQHHGISTPQDVQSTFRTPHNIGLLHAESATAALDPDNPLAHEAFESIGLNLSDYQNAPTPRIRGAKGIKPIFRMPKGVRLETKKLAFPYEENGRRKALTIFELRGAGGQDVLPPSLHPDGIYYEWVDGYPKSYEDFLELPPELLNLWQKWDFYLPIMQSINPYLQPVTVERKLNAETLSIIEQFNKSVDIAALLEEYGYVRK
jgi:hypothetical protein